jgi:hypothetical protein
MEITRLVSLIKALTGVEMKEEDVKKLGQDQLKALAVMDGYGVGDFADLSTAVGSIMKALSDDAGSPETPVTPAAEASVGDHDDLAELKALRDKLDGMISARETPQSPVEKQIADLTAIVAKLAKAQESGTDPPAPAAPAGGQADPEGEATLAELDARLLKLEKTSPGPQGIEPQAGGTPAAGGEVDNFPSVGL